MNENNKNKVLEFIKTQNLAVLSYVNHEANPGAALVGFTETTKWELIFGTETISRKYKSIKVNPHVAVVIGGASNVTVQIEGVAEELNSDNVQPFKDLHFKKNPGARKYENNLYQTYFKIDIKWIRYTDFNKDSYEVFEVNI